ncbi:MAG: hypothetical protein L0287_24210 [Anaerolineae bacterium]|nr:hypothetical protein [Anaerolineae bacterium]
MNVFYSDDKAAIYNGDVLEVLKSLPDNHVDLIFADPPFNLGKNYGETSWDKREDYYE